MRLEISGRAIVGSKEPQQDSWRVFNAQGEDVTETAQNSSVATGDGALVIVADGIGGYAGGDIASRVACDAFAKAFFRHEGVAADRLAHALDVANTAIADEKRRNPALKDMGCTLIGVHLEQDRIAFVSVGDSSLLRSRDDEIHRVNVDHSYFDYVDRKVLGSNDPDRWSLAVADARQRAALTLAVTGGNLYSGEYGHKPQVSTRPLLAGDVIVVASDGIETLDLVQVQNFLYHLQPSGIAGIANGLIGAVDGIGKNRSYQDNTTIVVIGASTGAGLTRVATTSRRAEAVPVSVSREQVSFFSRWRRPLDIKLLAGAAVTALVVLLLGYVLFAGGGFGDAGRSQNSPPATVAPPVTPPGKEQSPKASPQPRSEGTAPVNPQAGGPAGPAQVAGEAPQQEPAGAASQASTGLPESKAAPAQPAPDSQGQTPPQPSTPPQARAERETSDTAPKAELRAATEWANIVWQGTKLASAKEKNSDSTCFKACLESQTCVGFTSRGLRDNKRCELFSAITGYAPSQDAQSGAKEWNALAWQGDQIKMAPMNSDSSAMCFLHCLAAPECRGYSWREADKRCDLFSRIVKQVPGTGVASGSKEMK
jgi:serine/threonine protein phosphatase PrpC